MELFFAVLALYATLLAEPSRLEQCPNFEFANSKHAVMLPAKEGIAVGLSSDKDTFTEGERIELKVWAYNQSDRSQSFRICHPTTYEWVVYNKDGQPLETRLEALRRTKSDPKTLLWLELGKCYKSAVELPRHSCEWVDTFHVNRQYGQLRPGRYTVKEKHASPSTSLVINVLAKPQSEPLPTSVP